MNGNEKGLPTPLPLSLCLDDDAPSVANSLADFGSGFFAGTGHRQGRGAANTHRYCADIHRRAPPDNLIGHWISYHRGDSTLRLVER